MALCASTVLAADGDTVNYSRDIKPILSDNCYACHGPDENTRKAKLRLDTKEGALAALRHGGKPIVPGDVDASELFYRISTDDDSDLMPPPETKKTLTPQQIDLIKRWIEQGAPFDKHWAYEVPKRPPLPTLGAVADRARNPIDHFVFSRLEQEALTPSPSADPRTLARRLSFDLTGLPPSPEEVDSFVTEQNDASYEQLVDRLLDSPRFGERMAVHWLDLVRYADTTGIHGDNHREVSAYRDYVIDAFNDNKPFDWFTIEQIAGDLLPDPTTEQRIASGYNRLLMTTREGGAQPKEYRAKYNADRVRSVSSVWLGLTMGCAECHDHKFDPLTARDFYSMAAFFADISEADVGAQSPNLRLPTGEQRAELQRLDSMIANVQGKLSAQTPELDAALAAWEQEQSRQVSNWSPLQPKVLSATDGPGFVVEAEHIIHSKDEPPDRTNYVVSFYTDAPRITGLRLETFADDRLPSKGPGRAGNGNFVLSEFRVFAAPLNDPGNMLPVTLVNPAADFSQDSWPIANAIDGKTDTGWAISPLIGRDHLAVFEFGEAWTSDGGTLLTIVMEHHYGSAHNIGRFRISTTSRDKPFPKADEAFPPKDIRTILATAVDQRSPEQSTRLNEYFRGITPLLEPQRERLQQLTDQRNGVEEQVRTMLVSESIGEPRPVRILPRGNWLDETGELVTPAAPQTLTQLATDSPRPTRLDLARWLVTPDHPLTARVFVNRLWLIMFGRGIVATPEDFGSQGAWPTHPDLLDWLATEFVDQGWNVKHVLKLIAMSETYRQSSSANKAMRERDPANKLYARQNAFRLDAEFIRDAALTAGGLLVHQVGGPSVKPYQPAGYWGHLNFPKREYEADTGNNLYRRGLYTYWCRTFLHPSLLTFDAPTREECTAMRTQSNTPLQALVLLNDPMYVEAAKGLAIRVLTEAGESPDSRIDYAFRVTLHRPVRDEERSLLRELLDEHLKAYENDAESVDAIIGIGASDVPSQIDRTELAGWMSVTRTILNLHEAITRY